MRERWRILVEGIVQGVGFRPFVYDLASKTGLAGFVRNDAAGVLIELEGDPGALAACLRALQEAPPPLVSITHLRYAVLPPTGDMVFTIAPSEAEAERRAYIPPDTCPCDDCLGELFDPHDRRYGYAFLNCTNCGPRFTIIQDVPYDRERTTMADFRMCHACQHEYDSPGERRFHAQPNACPDCGPQLKLLNRAGQEVAGVEPVAEAARLLQEGVIVAVKGLGGYHLACDAGDDVAVTRLRQKKHREDKPFALMAPDVETIRHFCTVDSAEAALLQSRHRPIVLLRKRVPCNVAPAVAPGHRHLGVMLPYTPLHHLLLRETGRVLVMTSGNLSDEPIAYHDEDALSRLRAIADAFLVHNRAIHIRCDDTVTRLVNGQEMVLRRARGYVPQPIAMPVPFAVPLLACGAQLKNTFCLGKGQHAFVSHHIGDLENYETFSAFVEGIAHFQRLFAITPAVIAYDLHPEYLSTKYAMELQGVTRIGVQHHHAHIASCMAEHGLQGSVIGVAFDGLGYGTDGTLWGGEFFVATYLQAVRAAHLEYVPLPGGEQAIRQPWRMAATYLSLVYGEEMHRLDLDFIHRLDLKRWAVMQQMLRQGLNSPQTSSIGRLFDAVASLVGLRYTIHYEGQAAIELEQIADATCQEHYPFTLDAQGRPMVLRVGEVINGLVHDLRHGTTPSQVAAKFHNTLVAAIAAVCSTIRAQTGGERVVLSGGVFQNAFLLRRLVPCLTALGFCVYVPRIVPANDGGIALGQAAVANARLRAGMVEERGATVAGAA